MRDGCSQGGCVRSIPSDPAARCPRCARVWRTALSLLPVGQGALAVAEPVAVPEMWDFREFDGFLLVVDDRADFRRTHLAWRGLRDCAGGKLRLDFDVTGLEQSPGGPVPRQGPVLSPLVPLDANYNPRGAHIDPARARVLGARPANADDAR